jgi:N-acyl-D-aspartate/D-glutamate deacylase
LAVNIAPYIGFNSVWASVMGPSDHRPNAGEIGKMQALVKDNLVNGAWGVSAGLDYKPAYFAKVDEVIEILKPVAPWRTNFPNHDRLSPENDYSSRAGMLETTQIGLGAGLVPVYTHMKLQGHEQGTAGRFFAWVDEEAGKGHYLAADAYPYLAGQTSLVAFFVPGWAQDGGRDKMRERFRDPALRAKIVAEAEEALKARFGGPEGVYFPTTQRELVDIMKEMQLTSPGETIVRILEKEIPTVILRFGSEEDLRKVLQYPTVAVACDCGASVPGGRGHPRVYGTFPRVLGHYVRETKTLTWEDAIRKMTGLPANTIGLLDRGFIAPGMAADITVFDSATVIDHSTYQEPELLSEGIRYVVVNGRVALKDGTATGERGGAALVRSGHMPSRPMTTSVARRMAVSGRLVLSGRDAAVLTGGGRDSVFTVQVELTQAPNSRSPVGTVRVSAGAKKAVEIGTLGLLQTTKQWASVVGRGRAGSSGDERSVTVTVEGADPLAPGTPATITIEVEGQAPVTGTLVGGQVRVS